MAQLTIYGLAGCGPCEVAGRFCDQQKIAYTKSAYILNNA